MALDDVVSLSITAATATPSRANIGTLLIASQHAQFVPRVKSYSSAAQILADGFSATSPTYLIAAAAFGQTPASKIVKVGRMALPRTRVFVLTVTSATQGDIYSLDVYGSGGVKSTFSYTVPGAATIASVCTALAALITGVAGSTTTAQATTITLTATSGSHIRLANWSSNFQLAETGADPGIATDLAAIAAVDNDWYGLAVDTQSSAELSAAAAWALTNKKLFCATTSDYAVGAGGTSIARTLKNASNKYTYLQYHGSDTMSGAAAGLASRRFTATPGSDTWAYKTIDGVTVDVWGNPTFPNLVVAENANIYERVAGLNLTRTGKVSSGEWVDVIRFIDWLTSEIKVRVLAVLANLPKVPFTDAGIDTVVGAISSALADGVTAGGLVEGSVVITAPLASEVSSIDRGNRLLPNIQFSARLAGAIHTAAISGVVSV